MCRMYNDYGSVQRDKEERNLNSVDFEEFNKRGREAEGENSDEEEAKKKKELM